MIRQIKIIKNCSELGAGTRGSSLGYQALEIAALNSKNNFFFKHPKHEINNLNSALYKKIRFNNAKYINPISRVIDQLSNTVSNILSDNDIPIIISGDHSSAYGSLVGLKSVYPTKNIGVIWIDAHADLQSPYTSHSGNMHGMPLGLALNIDYKTKAVNKVSEEVRQIWENLKSYGNSIKKINAENLVYIGARDIDPIENEIIKENNILNVTVEEIRTKKMELIVKKISDYLKHCEIFYVSFDVDSLDPDKYSYGTGTPVKNGLFLEEVLDFFEKFQKEKFISCFEITEINPLLDNKKNLIAESGLKVINQFCKGIN